VKKPVLSLKGGYTRSPDLLSATKAVAKFTVPYGGDKFSIGLLYWPSSLYVALVTVTLGGDFFLVFLNLYRAHLIVLAVLEGFNVLFSVSQFTVFLLSPNSFGPG